MDIDYGTRRTVVPLLVEDVAGSQTALKVEEIGAKVDKLESIIESTVPRGCYTHWRIVDKETGELINQGMLDNAMNNPTNPGERSSLIGLQADGAWTRIQLIQTTPPNWNVIFEIPKVNGSTQKVELYNPYDTTVGVFEVKQTAQNLPKPIYLKHLPPYPSQSFVGGKYYYFYYPNGKDVYALNQAMGTGNSVETEPTVIGLLKNINTKLANSGFLRKEVVFRGALSLPTDTPISLAQYCPEWATDLDIGYNFDGVCKHDQLHIGTTELHNLCAVYSNSAKNEMSIVGHLLNWDATNKTITQQRSGKITINSSKTIGITMPDANPTMIMSIAALAHRVDVDETI